MLNQNERKTHNGKSCQKRPQRSEASESGTSASPGRPSDGLCPTGNISSPPTGCAVPGPATSQHVAPENQRQQISEPSPTMTPQSAQHGSAAKSTSSVPRQPSTVDATAPSTQQRLSTRTRTRKRGSDGAKQSSASTTLETKKRTFKETTTAKRTKERTRAAKDETWTGPAVITPRNPASGSAFNSTSADASPAPTDSGQPACDVAQAAISLSLTSAPLSSVEHQGPGELMSLLSKEEDVAQPSTNFTRPSSLEAALMSSVADIQPTPAMRSRGSRISGIAGPISAQLRECLLQSIDIRDPKAEIAAPRKVVAYRVITGAILVVGAFFVIFFILLSHPMSETFCDTDGCLHHADLLARIIDQTIDPCDDFSAFVCSRWQQAKFDHDVRSTIDSLRSTWYRAFDDTLRRGTAKLEAGRKPIAMYEMCIGRRPVLESHLPLLRAFLQEAHLTWPEPSNTTHSAFSVALSLAYRWRVSFWVVVTVLEHSSSSRRRVVVGPGKYVPVLWRYYENVEQSYLSYYKSFYSAYSPHSDADRDVNVTAVDEMRVLEYTVLSKLYSVIRSPSRTPSLFSLAEVDRRVPNASTAYWLPRFEEGLQLQPQLTPNDEVLVTDIVLLQTINSLTVAYGDQNLKALLAWQLVQFYSPLAEISLMTARFGSKEKADSMRPSYCAHNVEASFKVLVLSLGAISRLTVEDRRLISTGFGNLVSTAVGKVNDSHWMDIESKARVAQKLALVQMQMWPPESLLIGNYLDETYSDISENASSTFEYWVASRNMTVQMNLTQEYRDAMSLLGSNFPLYFAYDYVKNNVEIAIGAASAPAYYSDGTAAMFYGGLGFLMALQLVQSIDNEGLKWAPNKSIVHSILSESSAQSYGRRERCFGSNGTKSIFPEVPAVEVAFSAFKVSTLSDGIEHAPLGPQLPEDKVFFITVCFMTCATKGSVNPLSVDCNKMLQNSKAFATVYGCREGTKMNPVEKCLFFDGA